MMEAVRTSETSVDNLSTRQYNPEDSSEQHNLSLFRSGVIEASATNIHYCKFAPVTFKHWQ
jgi:hypothetical protein